MSTRARGSRKRALRSWAVSLSLFLGVGNLLFLCFTLQSKEAVSQRFSNAVDALELQRGFQGLVLDTAGLGGLLSGLVETDAQAVVLELRIQTPQKVLLQRSFSPPATSTFHWWAGEIGFERTTNGTRYSGKGLLSTSVLMKNGLLSIVLSVVLSLLEALARKWRKRRVEHALTERANRVAWQVAHDIRAPLGAILAVQSELSQLPEETRQVLELATTRIQRIANNLLSWKSTGHAQRTSIEQSTAPQRVNIAEAATALLKEKAAQYHSTPEIQLRLVVEENSPEILARVEPIEFQRILSNLIDNAVQALPREGGTVQILLETDQTWIRVRIADNGRGIPDEWISKLCEPGATFGKSNGTGLGLSHARSRTEAWGGTLGIKSAIGMGTTVTIQLPTIQVG